MSTEAQIPSMISGSRPPGWGVNTGAAEHIKLLHDRFPAMGASAIANKVGCDESNVRQVLARYVRDCSLEELREFQANKGDIFDAIQSKALSSITEAKLDNSSALQLMTLAAIAEDKGRLVRGQPTSMHVTALMDVAGMMREMREQGKLARQTTDIDGNDPSTAGDPGE